MRYAAVPTIDFIDAKGISYKIKDIYEIPHYDIATEIAINKGVYLDEIAHSDIVYGDVAKTYMIFEANADRIIDNNFNLEKIQSLRIPKA